MWETRLWARLIASASEPGNHHQGYRGYVAHNNVLRGYEFRSGDARREKQIEGQSMETSEKKKELLCPRDRHVAQAPQGAIITGAFHTVFPRKRGKQRQRLREESMLKEACHARDECGGFPQRKGNPRFCSPRTLCSAAGITHVGWWLAALPQAPGA